MLGDSLGIGRPISKSGVQKQPPVDCFKAQSISPLEVHT